MHKIVINYYDDFSDSETIENVTGWSYSNERYFEVTTANGHRLIRHSAIKSVETTKEGK